MSFILQPDIVRYSCTCGSLNSLSKLYFCRHCLKLRCGYCVCHEVDSSYCSNCLENIPSAEARLKKNRCATCYDCPSCFHTLSVRAGSVSAPSVDDSSKTITKKFYYMACSFCRWTSRDSGIPDQTAASGSWPERENPNATRVNILLDYYKVLAAQERLEKERRKYIPRRPRSRSPLCLDDRLGMDLNTARKRVGLPPKASFTPRPMPGVRTKTGLVFPPMTPAEAKEEVDPLPDSIFTVAPDLLAITTLAQRLAEPDFQPTLVSQLMPTHKHLYIKRSQRCRSCEHNVSKPEYSPASIKFKIQLSAYYHVPEVRVFTCEPLRVDSKSELILKLMNPTQNLTSVEFLPLDEAGKEEETQQVQLAGGDMSAELSKLSLSKSRLSGQLILPSCSVVLPQRDDAAEYDDSGELPTFQDDPKVVMWRKGNKVMVKMIATPQEAHGDVTVGFLLAYTYTNTMTPLGGEKERQKMQLHVPVYLKIGRVVGNK